MIAGIVEISASANGPFNHRAALGTLAAHAVPGLHHVNVQAGTVQRWLDVGGQPHALTLHLTADGVTVQADGPGTDSRAELRGRLRHWFDLDADIIAIDAHFRADPLLGQDVTEQPGVRITRQFDAFEAVVLTVLSQQVSLARARVFGARLLDAYGRDAPAGNSSPAELRRFPAAGILAARPLEELRAALGLTRSRARSVLEVAALFAGRSTTAQLPPRAELAAIHGIGPWTLDCLAVRTAGEPDVFPVGDAVLRRSLQPLPPAGQAERAAQWSPFRSYAAARLWAKTTMPG